MSRAVRPLRLCLAVVFAAACLLLPLRLAAAHPVPAPGWTLELLASAPDIQHPSVVCTAPDGRIFVGEDPMDIRTKTASVREGRIICFHPDGRRTVFATNLFAPFGLRYLEGKLYVLHNPRFTAFVDGGDRAGGEFDLITQTNPDPWALDWNDHVPANFKLAMDGFFYMAIGDKGLYGATDRSGKRVDLHGGGIARIRPDGTGLEVFSSGVRNILDVAMTSEDDLFTYDNTDEHQWMGRLTHMVDGGVYGYPFDFIPRRPYTLWMLADYGPGAATGAIALTGGGFPSEWRNNLILADFGQRNLRRVVLERAGGTFREVRNESLFITVPEDFRPVGITESHDGRSVLICDWQSRDTKDTNAVVGRLWKLTPSSAANNTTSPSWAVELGLGRQVNVAARELVDALAHPTKDVRLAAQHRLGRMPEAKAALLAFVRNNAATGLSRSHALWSLDSLDSRSSIDLANDIARSETDPIVIRQAVRLLANRASKAAVSSLVSRLKDADESIRFEAATALGRIADPLAVEPLLEAVTTETPLWIRYAAFTALNRIGRSNPSVWSVLVAALDAEDVTARETVSFALRETFDPILTQVLVRYCESTAKSSSKVTAIQLLGNIAKQVPAWKGEWWAYHPFRLQPPDHTVDWVGTIPILKALLNLVNDSHPEIRHAAIEGIRKANAKEFNPTLIAQFSAETNRPVRLALAVAIDRLGGEGTDSLLLGILSDPGADPALVIHAIRAAARRKESTAKDMLGAAVLEVSQRENLSPEFVQPLCEALGSLRPAAALPVLSRFAGSADLAARTAAVNAIGSFDMTFSLPVLLNVARSETLAVRQSAIEGLGRLKSLEATAALMELWRQPSTKADALAALCVTPSLSALQPYLAGLSEPLRTVRDASRKAVATLGQPALELIYNQLDPLDSAALNELRPAFSDQPELFNHPLFSKLERPLEQIDYERHATVNAGDPWRGQQLFFDPAGVACIQCHRVAENGSLIGPELTTAGKQFGRAALIEAILYPSKTVREGYQVYVIETKDGETFNGAIKAESLDSVTVADASGKLHAIPKSRIETRSPSTLSLMPDGLQSSLSLEDFADLVAYVESLKSDPQTADTRAVPEGFMTLWDGGELSGWAENPGRDAGSVALLQGFGTTNWIAKDGMIEHTGRGGNLWLKKALRDFEFQFEWRWPGNPTFENHPVIGRDGVEARTPDGVGLTERVLEAGDSGLLLRGLFKAQANLFCYPVGSGEFWEYREEASGDTKRRFTPRIRADRPIGQWNAVRVRLVGDTITIWINGQEVITETRLPGLPMTGPIGFQREHGRLQLRHLFLREL